MCAFKFRLESVVGLKKKKEDERKIALASAKKDLMQKEECLLSLSNEKRDCVEAVGNKTELGGVNIAEMLVYYAYLEKLTDEIAESAGAVERSREAVENKRELLLESSREKKALENLREKMKARYLLAARRVEQVNMDETAGRFHTLRSEKGLQWKEEDKP
ncbi:MAG: flagellar export protein FliJ [bacterium]|jgi:flagellar FliJ protein